MKHGLFIIWIIVWAAWFVAVGWGISTLLSKYHASLGRSYVRQRRNLLLLALLGCIIALLGLGFLAGSRIRSLECKWAVTSLMALYVIVMAGRRLWGRPLRQTAREYSVMWQVTWHSTTNLTFLLYIGFGPALFLTLALFFPSSSARPAVALGGLALVVLILLHTAKPPDILLLGPSAEVEVELQLKLAVVCGGRIRVTSLLRPEHAGGLGPYNLDKLNFLRARDSLGWQRTLGQLMQMARLIIIDVRVSTPHVLHEVHSALTPQYAHKTLLVVGFDGTRPAVDALVGTVPLTGHPAAQVADEGLEDFVTFLVGPAWRTFGRHHSLGDIAAGAVCPWLIGRVVAESQR